MPSTVRDDNNAPAAGVRVRRTPEASRRAVLDAAQNLLIASGPAAVTLKAVADAVGMTHGNVTHHFGTSAALHAALVTRMAEGLAREADAAVEGLRRGETEPEAIVNMVFSAFADRGCGRLIGWLAATGQSGQLAPIFAALGGSVAAFRAGEPETTDRGEHGAGPIVLGLLSHALTASLIGEPLERAAGMEEGSLRRLAAGQLRSLRATE